MRKRSSSSFCTCECPLTSGSDIENFPALRRRNQKKAGIFVSTLVHIFFFTLQNFNITTSKSKSHKKDKKKVLLAILSNFVTRLKVHFVLHLIVEKKTSCKEGKETEEKKL
jgi:hypothetical protein